MQTANVLLSLGGDHGNTVPKFGCTAAEIGVLLAIHGNEAVREIEPSGDVKRSHREERIRLLNIYGGAKTEDQKPIVEGMFPGVAARVFESLDELGLDESFFKATGRLKATPVDDRPLEAAFADETYATVEAEVTEAEDGIGEEMSDRVAIDARREERAAEKDNVLG